MKPTVLFVVDIPRWAHDFKTRHIARSIADQYRIVRQYQYEVLEEDLDEADLVVVYYWQQIARTEPLLRALDRNAHKLLLGVTSHLELEGADRDVGLDLLARARAVFAPSRLLFEAVRPQLHVPIFYTPNGVDTRFFRPRLWPRLTSGLRVGWAGSLSNWGSEERGFHTFIVPSVAAVTGAELLAAVREDRWRTQGAMRDFYRSLDVYMCASRTEGTPNPCLEAAACGVPVVSTPVGNMPELIRSSCNGFLVRREVSEFVSALQRLQDDIPLRRRLGRAIRRSAKLWDWRLQAQNYRLMFDMVLGR